MRKLESYGNPSIQGQTVTVTRVYNNGDKHPMRMAEKDAIREVEYNHTYRFGTAVFYNAECVQTGYLGAEKCALISKELQEITPLPETPTFPPAASPEEIKQFVLQALAQLPEGSVADPEKLQEIVKEKSEALALETQNTKLAQKFFKIRKSIPFDTSITISQEVKKHLPPQIIEADA